MCDDGLPQCAQRIACHWAQPMSQHRLCSQLHGCNSKNRFQPTRTIMTSDNYLSYTVTKDAMLEIVSEKQNGGCKVSLEVR